MVARNTGCAIKGREKLKVVWDNGPNATYDSAAFRQQMEATAANPGMVVRNDGDAEGALKSAAKVITAQYYVPHLAHASMEPPSAVVTSRRQPAPMRGLCGDAKPGRLPRRSRQDARHSGRGRHGQRPAAGRRLRAQVQMGLRAGSGPGLKAIGAPIKLTWTREDDIQHDFYHTVSVERIDAGVDANGKVVAWRHRSVAPTILSTFKAGADHEAPFELGMGLIDNPFDIPNLRCENGACEAHTRIGWFRSVSNIPHAFAVQSMVAEIAAALGRDPKDVLLELIGPDRIVDPRKSPRWPTTGTTAIRSRPTRSKPAGCAASRNSPPSTPDGASSCRRARASASPRIAAS